MADPREEKLPLWAKQEMKNLRSDLEHMQTMLDQFRGEVDTDTFLIDGMKRIPLPKTCGVEFVFGPEYWNTIRCYIGDNGKSGDKWLDVSGGDCIKIEPRASNVIHVRCEK